MRSMILVVGVQLAVRTAEDEHCRQDSQHDRDQEIQPGVKPIELPHGNRRGNENNGEQRVRQNAEHCLPPEELIHAIANCRGIQSILERLDDHFLRCDSGSGMRVRSRSATRRDTGSETARQK